MCSNETKMKFGIVIKLRADNIYDLYFNERWVASRGSYRSILEEARIIIEEELLNS